MSKLPKNKTTVWLTNYSAGTIEEKILVKRKSGVYSIQHTDIILDHTLTPSIEQSIAEQNTDEHVYSWGVKLNTTLSIASSLDWALWCLESEKSNNEKRLETINQILQTYNIGDSSLLHNMQPFVHAQLVRLNSDDTSGFVEVYYKSNWSSAMHQSMGRNANLLLHQGLGVKEGRLSQENMYVRIGRYGVGFYITDDLFNELVHESQSLIDQAETVKQLQAMWGNHQYGFSIEFQQSPPHPYMAYKNHWCHFEEGDYERAQKIISKQLPTALSVAARSNLKTKSKAPVVQFALSRSAAEREGVNSETDGHCLIEYSAKADLRKNTYYGMSKPLTGLCFGRTDGTVSLYIQGDPNHVHKLTAEAYRQLMRKSTSVLDALIEADQ
jgi:hypothetical protein